MDLKYIPTPMACVCAMPWTGKEFLTEPFLFGSSGSVLWSRSMRLLSSLKKPLVIFPQHSASLMISDLTVAAHLSHQL